MITPLVKIEFAEFRHDIKFRARITNNDFSISLFVLFYYDYSKRAIHEYNPSFLRVWL